MNRTQIKQYTDKLTLAAFQQAPIKGKRGLPNCPALYVIVDDLQRVLYVGETLQLAFRLTSNNHRGMSDPRATTVYWLCLTDAMMDHRHYMEQLLTDRFRPLLELEPTKHRCRQCQHRWIARIAAAPLRCPKCGSSEWMNPPKTITLECKACWHEWTPRKEGKPVECPNCKNRKWDKAR